MVNTSIGRKGKEVPIESPVDLIRAEFAVRELMLALSLDPDDDMLRDTPARVAATFGELCAGLGADAGLPLEGGDRHLGGDISITLNELTFRSMCPHHLLPYSGRIEINYVPGARLIGIGSFVRTIDILSARPQLQESLAKDLADMIVDRAQAVSARVSIVARHPCVADRGPREENVMLETIVVAAKDARTRT